MKKFFYILIGICTFSVGLWSYLSRPLVTPVPLCEISQHIEFYRSKQIDIKASLDIVSLAEDQTGEDYYSVYDFNDSCLTGTELEISEKLRRELENDQGLKSFITELSEKNKQVLKDKNSSGIYVAEVEIGGEIVVNEQVTSHSRPFIIKAGKIKQISPIRFLENEQIRQIRWRTGS